MKSRVRFSLTLQGVEIVVIEILKIEDKPHEPIYYGSSRYRDDYV
ncbi:MAG: hypothetical protein O6837_14385 [Deltaproteobacteria bacterium]|nr:hypothetical protein [Deltaproteobacteria bacterium]MCZ6549285.1 hypothetical protein [Deltaproteobacteria bacterium]MCZ6562501.1 hypothetical protein [Deltaproteobacteria bacterium]MCZ6622293.1 hypothetical protein [Deltaproteobacteria bacterium]MCZ6907119.1 hypothetical protein [Deltaproteobacteria bacterium]